MYTLNGHKLNIFIKNKYLIFNELYFMKKAKTKTVHSIIAQIKS
jgi:hypothetical protein